LQGTGIGCQNLPLSEAEKLLSNKIETDLFSPVYYLACTFVLGQLISKIQGKGLDIVLDN